MPLQATSGAASYDGFGGGVPFEPIYIEQIFATHLYTGNDSVQTITNGIDLAGKGGLIWLKKRNNTSIHGLWDTARGGGSRLDTSSTAAPGSVSPAVTFNSNGFTLPAGGSSYLNESSTNTYVSWTFRKQPKFFDVVTYTGDGNSTSRNIAHDLGSVAGTIIVKRTDSTSNWAVAAYDGTNWKVGTTTTPFALNLTNASTFNVGSVATSTTFNVCRMQWSSGGNPTDDFNASGATYVAYLFAHDAGGFGLSGSDNVISCGSYVGNALSDGPTITLGYEPQWILVKDSSFSANWQIVDSMRGLTVDTDQVVRPNTSAAEYSQNLFSPTATGFKVVTTSSDVNRENSTYIYIAIRRGPMKTPTSGTSVYNAVTYTGNQTARNITGYGFPLDLVLGGRRNDTNNFKDYWFDRLRGATKAIDTNVSGGTAAEYTDAQVQTSFALQDGTSVGTDSTWNATGINIVLWGLRRAPGFFDVVCYTGTGSATTFSHNLGVVPEMMIVKRRSTADNWFVYSQTLGNTKHIALDGSGGASGNNIAYWNNTSPTASVFSVGNDSAVNASASTYVNYLFASCPGVSKVGSYTGTGTTLQIDCGFTGGARWVMIKRTDSTGDWYVWDSARGIVAGNDPYLLLNSTAAEVTNTDYIDTYSAGFEISSTAPAAINANGGSFVFLAIA